MTIAAIATRTTAVLIIAAREEDERPVIAVSIALLVLSKLAQVVGSRMSLRDVTLRSVSKRCLGTWRELVDVRLYAFVPVLVGLRSLERIVEILVDL